MSSEKELIRKCVQNDSEAQEKLYKLYAPKMFGVCLRYAKNHMEAEDVLQEGFIKVFVHLKDYRNEGSLEGWIRRTIVNTAINFYRKSIKSSKDIDIDDVEISNADDETVLDQLSTRELLDAIRELPDGYRIVFNLNVLEGYTHKEIGQMLNLSENTSKSQLSRARQVLQKRLKNLLK
ncbi:MAG: RNA polymerase sigma factor [Bacteroidales bacterium]|nr:RNA polymerase sigma factor [Bacteroidales bacterium]MCF8388486.1 RNA polymerase sigma factor [Bacteroidales bacterium]MCF8397074.1 RNA polymerase sigma factor [Bacteroidales bacterium]